MDRYTAISAIDYDGRLYRAGESIEAPPEIAAPLLDAGVIEPASTDTRIPREGADGSDTPHREPSTGAGTVDGKPATMGDDPPSAPAADGGEPSSQHHTPASEPAEGGAAALPSGTGHTGPAEARHAAIVAAVRSLDPKDSKVWSGRGKSRRPKVAALEAVLGHDITAAERDAAWTTVQAGG